MILLLILLIFAAAGAGWWKYTFWKKDASPTGPATAQVIRRDFSSTVLATGAVKSQVGSEVKVGAHLGQGDPTFCQYRRFCQTRAGHSRARNCAGNGAGSVPVYDLSHRERCGYLASCGRSWNSGGYAHLHSRAQKRNRSTTGARRTVQGYPPAVSYRILIAGGGRRGRRCRRRDCMLLCTVHSGVLGDSHFLEVGSFCVWIFSDTWGLLRNLPGITGSPS